MSEVTMETTESQTPSCPTCEQAAQEAAGNEEVSMAFLLALMPVLSLTLFGQMGLL